MTSLFIIACCSALLLAIAIALILPHDMQDSYDIKRPKFRLTTLERIRVVALVWLLPTLLALIAWILTTHFWN